MNKQILDSFEQELNKRMRPLFPYYGGKQTMTKEVLEIIPEHKVYVEPFCGGATIFFAKKLAKVNILNDIDDRIINIYIQATLHKEEFITALKSIPYSKRMHKIASKELNNKDNFFKAIMTYYTIISSFSNGIGKGFGCSKVRNHATQYQGYLNELDTKIEKLKYCTIMNEEAISIIKKFDSEKTLFYLDPPYPEAHQAHYGGYTYQDYEKLLDVLYNIQGKFILSSYLKNIQKYDLDKKFNCLFFEKVLCANKVSLNGQRKKKIEALVFNFECENKNILL